MSPHKIYLSKLLKVFLDNLIHMLIRNAVAYDRYTAIKGAQTLFEREKPAK